jgi:hypothetical protein
LADIIEGLTHWIDTDFMHYQYTTLNGMHLAPHEGGRTPLEHSMGTLIHRLKHLMIMINNMFLKITGPTQFKDSSWQQ